MKTILRLLLATLVAVSGHAIAGAHRGAPAPTPDRYVVIHAGTLLTVPGEPPRSNMSVVVRNDRIERVAAGQLDADAIDAPTGSSVEIIDLSDRFVLPGLMDAHVHLRGEPSRGSRRRERGDRPEPLDRGHVRRHVGRVLRRRPDGPGVQRSRAERAALDRRGGVRARRA